MNLKDGLTLYQSDPTYWQLSLETEQTASQVVSLLETHRQQPTAAALSAAKNLLMLIEK